MTSWQLRAAVTVCQQDAFYFLSFGEMRRLTLIGGKYIVDEQSVVVEEYGKGRVHRITWVNPQEFDSMAAFSDEYGNDGDRSLSDMAKLHVDTASSLLSEMQSTTNSPSDDE